MKVCTSDNSLIEFINRKNTSYETAMAPWTIGQKITKTIFCRVSKSKGVCGARYCDEGEKEVKSEMKQWSDGCKPNGKVTLNRNACNSGFKNMFTVGVRLQRLFIVVKFPALNQMAEVPEEYNRQLL